MFYIKEPCRKNSPWILSHYKDEKVISISKDTLKDMRNYHIMGIDFLYQAYRKEFKGVILNEEDGMNMQLQVAVFLNSMRNNVELKFLVLVITPDCYLMNWHYHLIVHGGFKVKIVTPKTCPEEFDQEHGLVLLLPFSNLKLSEYLTDYDYFSVIIDGFDEVATKLVIRRLRGNFNVGLTERSFYTDPDQKLQWTMLNWCSPGCVGKLGDFYLIDNDNFANFRDNYRHWWFRLTWNFCESFKKITNEEKQEFKKRLSKWAASNNLKYVSDAKPESKCRKRKKVVIISDDNKTDVDGNKTSETFKNENIKSETIEESNDLNESKSSEDTIIYDPELEKERDPTYVELPSMDENPILSSIIRNLEKSPEPVLTQHPSFSYSTRTEPNCSKDFEGDDVLLSIIDDKIPVKDEDTELECKKEEIRSQIFDDKPCTSRSFTQEDDRDFFQSFIDSDVPAGAIKSENVGKRKRNDDVEAILRETELLLKE